VPLMKYASSAINLPYQADKHNQFDELSRFTHNPFNLAEQTVRGITGDLRHPPHRLGCGQQIVCL
jgi:hypothetical protein